MYKNTTNLMDNINISTLKINTTSKYLSTFYFI